MKKSILARIGVVATALTLATTSMMSGTLARFSTSAKVSGTVLVANWTAGVKASTDSNSMGEAITTSKEISLGETLVGVMNQEIDTTLVTRDDGTTKLIAPGSKGVFYVQADVTGTEVPVLMTMQMQKTKGDIPDNLTITVSDLGGTKTYGKKTGEDLGSGDTVDLVSGAETIRFAPSSESGGVQKKTFKVTWEWPLDASDGDTATYNSNDVTAQSADASFTITTVLNQQGTNDKQFTNATA